MAGIFHAYYTVALSPAIAVLVAICGASLLVLRDRPWMPGIAGLLVAMTSAWDMALILRSGSFVWLGVCIGVIGVVTGLALCIIGFWMQDRLSTTWPLTLKHGARGVAAIGIVALLAGPIVWTACTISTGHTGSIVTAGPGGSMGGGPGGGGPGGNRAQDDADGTAADGSSSESVPVGGNGAMPDGGSGLLGGTSANDSLVELLTQNASGYRWAAATTGSQNAASYQLASELPVMAIGGFNGSDPAPTLDEFKVYVAQGLIRYYIASGGMGGTQMGGSSAASEIAEWVAQNYTAQTVGNTTVYDLQEQ